MRKTDSAVLAGGLAIALAAFAAVLGGGKVAAAEIKAGSFQLSDETVLNYLEAGSGSGSPVVLIPGWSQTAEMYKAQLEALSGRYRVIAVDMRGHGDSSKPDSGYEISRLAQDVHEFLAGMNLTAVALGGHSMGSSIIWSYWHQFGQDRLAKLIIIDQAPAVTALATWSDEEKALAGTLFTPHSLWDTASALAGPDGVATTEGFVRDVFFTPAYPRENLGYVLAQNLKMPRNYAARLLVDHCMQDWREVIKTISLPTIVFGGEASIFNPASQRWIADQIAGAEAHIFPTAEGGSHFMFMENPEKFNALLEDFLGG